MTTLNQSTEFHDGVLAEFSLQGQEGALACINEEFRAIKRAVLSEALPSKGDNRPLVMVTSVSEGEGKTFTAVNLARSLSYELNKNVLLADCNVLNPTLNRLMKPAPKTGLIDFLNDDDMELSRILYNTPVKGLKLLPTGEGNFLANELLGSDRMQVLMDDFRTRYHDRVVVFDAPPIIGVNETITLAQSMDQIIVVVEEGKVKTRDLKNALGKLPKGVKVHFVLNKTLSGSRWEASQEEPEFSPNDQAVTGAGLLN